MPVNLADPSNTASIVHWFKAQHWLDHRASGHYRTHADMTWRDVYAGLCLDLAERRIGPAEYAASVRDMVAAAIENAKHDPTVPRIVASGYATDGPTIEGFGHSYEGTGLSFLPRDSSGLHRPAFEVLKPVEPIGG